MNTMTLAELLSDLRFLLTHGPEAHATRPEMVRASAIELHGEHLVELGWAGRDGAWLWPTEVGLDVYHETRDIVLPE